MKRLFFQAGMVLLLFLMTSPVYASQITNHDMTVTIGDDSTRFDISVNYQELTTNKVYYAAYSRITNLKVHDSLGALACDTETKPYGVEIACTPLDKNRKNYTVALSYDALNLVSKSADAKTFAYTSSVREPTQGLTLLLVLPEGYGIVEDKGFESYYPQNGVVGGTGRKATILWVLKNPALGKATPFTVYFEKISIGDNTTLPLAIVLFAAIIFSAVVFYRRTHEKKSKMVLSVLKGDERSILEAIQEKGENCRQRDIVKITDFSKARISRILEDMEKRGIVERTRSGRTNRVRIKDATLKIPKSEKNKEEKEKKTIPFS